MPVYKVTRVHKVRAESKAAAREAVGKQPEEYLDFESIYEVAENQNGWFSLARKQVTGR